MKKTLLCLVALSLLAVQHLSAQNTCFSDWRFVRNVEFSNVFGPLTDFPVFFDLNTQALIASGKMNANGSDLRITGPDDCCTELNYWIQSGLNTPTTRIWVLVPNVNGPGITRLTVYYGNGTVTQPVSNIDGVMLSLGNDSTGTAPSNAGETNGTQLYRFSTDCKTVRWRIYTGDSATFRLKTIDSTDRVRGFSPFVTTPAAPGFYEFDFNGNSTQDGYPGWYSAGSIDMMNACAPALPCPGSCGDLATVPGDAGNTTLLPGNDCGSYPSMKVWYRNVRNSFYVDPTHVIRPEFDRQSNIVTVSATRDTICTGDSATLSANAGGAIGYEWYRDSLFAGSGQNLTVFTAGAYYCVATYGPCLTANSTEYTISAPASGVNLGPDRVECTDSSYVLDAGPNFASYYWSNNSTGQSITVSTDGIFWVTATDSGGCVSTDTVVLDLEAIPDPVITPGPDVNICEGTSVTLDSYDPDWFIYNWSPGGQTSSDITVNTAGTFQVTVTSSAGCVGTSDSVVVSIIPVTQVTLPGDTTLCEEDSLVLTVSSDWSTILWADSVSNTTSYTVYTEGDYWVEVEDSNGCSSRDTISVDNFTPAVIDLGPDQTICPSDVVVLDAGAGFASYLWSEQSTSPTISVGGGAYFVMVTDLNGCNSMSNVVTISEFPQLPEPTVSYTDGVLVSEVTADNYQWFGPGGAISGANSQTYVPTESGSYYVEISDADGCELLQSHTVVVVLSIAQEDIPQGFSPNGDGQNDFWEVPNIDQYGSNTLTIINRWGNEVFVASPYQNNFNGQWEGKDLPAGTYFYELDLGNGSDAFTGYIIIKR